MSEEYKDLQDALTDALSDALSKYDKSFIVKWITVIEVIDQKDGDRGLWSVASPKTKTWDIKGMLHHAIDMQVSDEYVRAARGDDDE